MDSTKSRVTKNTKEKRPDVHKKLEKLPANEFIELMGLADDPKVKILVGPQAKAYSLSRKMLCQSSAYFTAAFEGNFQEGDTQTLTLEEEDVDAFELLIQYIYTREITLPKSDPPNPSDNITRYLHLIKISDKLGFSGLVDIANKEVNQIISGDCLRIQLVHLALVFGADWPSIAGSSVRLLLIRAVSKIYITVAIGHEKAKEWPLEKVLADVPGLAYEVSLMTIASLKRGAEKLGPDVLFDALI